jgi:hypothetical protein
VLAAELRISHALSIPLKIICFGANLLSDFDVFGLDRAECTNQLFDFAAIQQLLVHLHPGFLFCLIIRVQLAGYLPEMLAGVVEIDDVNGAWKVQFSNIPDPLGAVADDHLQQRAAPPASGSFGIDSPAKFFCCFDRSRVGGGIRVADGIALLIPRGLGEYAA